MTKGGDWSKIEVALVGDRSRLTSCLSIAPLKILSPRGAGNYCSAILSSYGGGLVAGDDIRLRVRCREGARFFLGTQAFTKVYKADDGQVVRQEIAGHIEADARVVVLPDPVVPYADSAFVQEQDWRLDAGGLLVLLDGATAGRGERGERFAYGTYASNITIHRQDEPVLIERFQNEPDAQAPDRVGVFGAYAAMANAYVVGAPGSALVASVAAVLRERLAAWLDMPKAEPPATDMVVSLAEARPGVVVLRALGRGSEALDPVWQALAAAVASPELLGENPLRRKY